MERAAIETPSATRRALLAAAIGFVLLVAAGPVVLVALPKVQTRATPPWPEWSTAAFLDGEYTEALRRHLRESSPITVVLRGVYNEARYLLGGEAGGQAVLARGGALFPLGDTARSRPGARRQAEARRRAFADVARWSASRGVHVLAVIPPDKARIHAELWTDDGRLPPARRTEYADLLTEVRSAGVPAVDLEALYLEWRRARPAEPLYLERDSHWNHRGVLLAALAAAREVEERGWAEALGPPDDLVPLPLQSVVLEPDLADLLGFLPEGLYTEQLAQPLRVAEVLRRGPSGLEFLVEPAAPRAAVAVCGDSFAQQAFGSALAGVLGRIVDREGAIAGGGPMLGLAETMARVDSGELRARILVWVFVERALVEGGWSKGPPIPEPR